MRKVGHQWFPLLAVVFCSVFLSGLGCISDVDRIVVPMAVLAPESGAWDLPALDGQRIIDGNQVVLSRREFRWMLPPLPDTQEFRVLSVVIPTTETSSDFDIGSGQVRLAYSRGNSALPLSSCIAYAATGSIAVRRLDEETVHVKLSAKIASGAKGANKGDCMNLTIEDEGIYQVTQVRDLSPWLGGPFEHPYDASFR